MEEYRVRESGELTIVESVNGLFMMRVDKVQFIDNKAETATLEATLYKEEGAFVKDACYRFEAVNEAYEGVSEADLNTFKDAVDFYFTSILKTDLFVKEIPRASSLCHRDLKAFQFETH